MQKVLIIILVLLGTVIAGEIGYLIGLKKNYCPSASPSATICATPTPFPDAAIDPQTLRTFSVLHKSVVFSSTAISEFRGKITELEFDKGWAFKIRLTADDNQTNAFLFNKDELNKLVFVKKDKDKETVIKKEELKINDQIAYTETVDLTKPSKNNFITGKITKL